ncbi:MAG: hypothetical protein KDK70_07935 [Myxococcales bacterium]|nr:hypothetical protein [Myxococcales bacterium]
MRRRASLLLVAVGLLVGCGDATGAVELAWVFVDRGGDPIFPGGVFSVDDEHDSCELPGVVADQGVPYDLRVELEICDPACEAGCDAEECLVLPRRRFGCNTARGNEPEVPASDEPYRFTLRAVVGASSIDVDCPEPTCIAVPAPRERVVEAGRVTDLQVYQLAVDVDRNAGERLDLEACGCA